MTEAELQAAIISLAKTLGWLCYHTYRSTRSESGFPDLVLAKGGRVLLIELKGDKGKLGPGQQEWLNASGGLLLRPKDWPEAVLQVLSSPRQ